MDTGKLHAGFGSWAKLLDPETTWGRGISRHIEASLLGIVLYHPMLPTALEDEVALNSPPPRAPRHSHQSSSGMELMPGSKRVTVPQCYQW